MPDLACFSRSHSSNSILKPAALLPSSSSSCSTLYVPCHDKQNDDYLVPRHFLGKPNEISYCGQLTDLEAYIEVQKIYHLNCGGKYHMIKQTQLD
jgi:hypothetical protein